MKKCSILSLLLCFLLTSVFFPAADALADHSVSKGVETPGKELAAPVLSSEAGLLMDAETGQILYQKNADERMYPASITKILTAIVALEHGDLEELVTVSEKATHVEGTRVYLVEGEQISLDQLLYGMMVNSGNDAAVAIAEHIGGTVEEFAVMMNRKARELGANRSHFVNASGLHDENHYTTAKDMALIAHYAMKMPEFRQIVETRIYPWESAEWQTILVNHNQLLGRYEGATGIKNGYTSAAGQTFVGSARRASTEFIAVCLSAPSQNRLYEDVTHLMDYGFLAFEDRLLVDAEQSLVYRNTSGVVIPLTTGEDIYGKVPVLSRIPESRLQEELQKEVVVPSVNFPVYQGNQLGSLALSWNEKDLFQVPLYAAQTVTAQTASAEIQRAGWSKGLAFFSRKIWAVLLAGGAVLALIFLLWMRNKRGESRSLVFHIEKNYSIVTERERNNR